MSVFLVLGQKRTSPQHAPPSPGPIPPPKRRRHIRQEPSSPQPSRPRSPPPPINPHQNIPDPDPLRHRFPPPLRHNPDDKKSLHSPNLMPPQSPSPSPKQIATQTRRHSFPLPVHPLYNPKDESSCPGCAISTTKLSSHIFTDHVSLCTSFFVFRFQV